ncbi:hypothetical protein FC39_GL000591 [Lactobacillus hamsteri DSM 5661 = JCM 6256]|uniref:Uncharacterized protein n=1 Tax=Lactobacillus hamsteri DSM 5661 = JCM 6256 TaxID=1423754 RepID=A0A0R1YEZ2_9LACO|nr:hypothetical protein FC39_GL000591 [Lactobacillus hamsteri DSM 5661 = JCM 6256]
MNWVNKTKKFIRSRRISAILPWIGMLGMLYLVFSLIMHGLLAFIINLGFIANFYYIIDEYNWLIERISFDSQRLIANKRKGINRLVMIVSIVIAVLNTIILILLKRQDFISFCVGLCFISEIYFVSRLIENFQVILHIAFDSWKKFYILVVIGTAVSSSVYLLLLCFSIIAYFIYFAIIGIMYVITYYILIEIHDRVENDLGGHKYFIDLPDNRFGKRF